MPAFWPQDPLPDGEVTHERTPNVEVVQFGDGYTQRYKEGINTVASTYRMQWSNLYASERNVIYNFVEQLGGQAFYYQFLTDESPRLFIAPNGVREIRKNGEFFDIEVEWQEVFDLGFADAPTDEIAGYININRGEPIDYELEYAGPIDITGTSLTVYEASHPAFHNAVITMTDPENGKAQFYLAVTYTNQLPLGTSNWFRLRLEFYEGTPDVTPKIGVNII